MEKIETAYRCNALALISEHDAEILDIITRAHLDAGASLATALELRNTERQ